MVVLDTEKQYEKVPTKEVFSDNETQNVPPSYGYGMRHMQSLLLFVCMTIAYIGRAHLGVSIVAMTNSLDIINHSNLTNEIYTNSNNGTNITVNETELELNVNENNKMNITENQGYRIIENLSNVVENKNYNKSMWNVFRTYEWSKPTQEMILDAFFFGYCLMMFPTGMICQRFGGKLPLQMCLLINGIVSLVTPTVAVWGGWQAVCCCRFLQGMSQSGMFPSAHTLLSKWVPISERASLAGFVYTGTLVGTVVAFQIAGLLSDSKAGWPGTFWLTGVLCIGALALLSIFGAASPSDHKSISEEEKNFIMGRIDDGSKKVAKMPWKKVFKSEHIWATIATHVASSICFVFLFTQIPTYMHYILRFDVKNSGLLSSLPYLASAFTAIGYGTVSDYCTNRGYFNRRIARILCNTLAQWGPALCLVAVSFIDNSAVAVLLLVLALALYSGIHSGWMVNYIDLAPNFGGALMATGNTFATLAILSQPFLVSNIVEDVTNRYQWRIMMFLMAALIFVSNALFMCFMSADTQPWNEVEEQEDKQTEKAEKAL